MKKRNGNQWDRVTGDNLDQDTELLMKANKSVYESEKFKEACKLAGVPVTTRQASKFRRKLGIAYKTINGLI